MREERGRRRKRALADVSGDHEVQQKRPKRIKLELDDTSAKNNGFIAFLNGDTEAEPVVDSAGKIAGASTAGSYSALNEFSHSDALLSNKDDALAGSSGSFSEWLTNKVDQAFASSDTSSEADSSATVNDHLSTAEKENKALKESVSHEELENHNDCKSTMKSQNTSLKRKIDSISDFTENGSKKKARLDFSSSKNLVYVNGGLTEPIGEFSEAKESAIVNNHLSSVEKDNNEFKVNISHEELENHNDCKSTLKPQNTSHERKKDSMPDFTENGLEKKVRLDFSSSKNLVDVNGCLIEPAGEFSEIRNNIKGETDSQIYINVRILIKSTAVEKDIVNGTTNHPSHSTEVSAQHKIDLAPLLAECLHNEKSEIVYKKTMKVTEENLSGRSISSIISIEINKEVLNGNFKAESSLPPSQSGES